MNTPGGFWTQMFLATRRYICEIFKHELQEAPIQLTFEARTDISTGGRENFLPKASWCVYIYRSSQKNIKIRSDYIHPPGMVHYLHNYIYRVSKRVISTEFSLSQKCRTSRLWQHNRICATHLNSCHSGKPVSGKYSPSTSTYPDTRFWIECI